MEISTKKMLAALEEFARQDSRLARAYQIADSAPEEYQAGLETLDTLAQKVFDVAKSLNDALRAVQQNGSEQTRKIDELDVLNGLLDYESFLAAAGACRESLEGTELVMDLYGGRVAGKPTTQIKAVLRGGDWIVTDVVQRTAQKTMYVSVLSDTAQKAILTHFAAF